jgi:hypothetical protein
MKREIDIKNPRKEIPVGNRDVWPEDIKVKVNPHMSVARRGREPKAEASSTAI